MSLSEMKVGKRSRKICGENSQRAVRMWQAKKGGRGERGRQSHVSPMAQT